MFSKKNMAFLLSLPFAYFLGSWQRRMLPVPEGATGC